MGAAGTGLRTRSMKYLHVAALLLLLSTLAWTAPTPSDDDSESSDDSTEKAPSSTESKAGEAIKTLLQEKITQKFKEAANEVKGVLVKQLGDSLKSAHEAFNPPKEKEVGKKVGGAVKASASESKAGTSYKIKSGRKLHNPMSPSESYEQDSQSQTATEPESYTQ